MEEFFEALLMAIFDTNHIDSSWLKFSNDMTLTMVRSVWAYIGLFGMGLTLVYFIIEMNSKLAIEGAQNMTMKSFMAPFLKLAIAIVILHNGGNIVNQLLLINNTVVDWANTDAIFGGSPMADVADANGDGVPDTSQDVFDGLKERFKDFGFFEKAFVIIVTVLIWIVSMIMLLIWVYKAFMYKLEVLWRTAITLVALADVYSGNHSNAIRWLKGFLGLALYAMAIMAMPRVASVLAFSTGSLEADWSVWECLKCLLATLIAPFAALGVMSTIKQMCKEALG